MTKTNIKTYSFSDVATQTLGADIQEMNWPVVYQIYDEANVYVGETTNLKNRMTQHRQNVHKKYLSKFSVLFNDSFNKSAALDLEAHLIKWFSGDGKYKVLNKNDGLVDHDYFDRQKYRDKFTEIWNDLRSIDLAINTVKNIENSGLFKFSPYKQLNGDQIEKVYNIMLDLEESFKEDGRVVSVVGGSEGTGKTIVIMYLIKLIRDVQDYGSNEDEDKESDNSFSLFFEQPFKSRFKNKKIALVVPNPSLKGSIAKVLKAVDNLSSGVELLSPIEFGLNGKTYDVTFIDEAHLLKATNQEVHKANRAKVDSINSTLFGDNKEHSELEWLAAKSRNVVMVYGDQRIRPNNITYDDILRLNPRIHNLKAQLRSQGGELYINYLRDIFSIKPPTIKEDFANFEFKIYDDFKAILAAIKEKDKEVGLSRMVAGFAWDWKSKKDKQAVDIEIDGIGLRWNSKLVDYLGSKESIDEVGSIYTLQGYDLNYCGVIIGNDLQYDEHNHKLVFSRKDYYDRGAKKRNKNQIENNVKLTEEELLAQVIRTYRILMNRSIKGTFVYVCDPGLRNYLYKYLNKA